MAANVKVVILGDATSAQAAFAATSAAAAGTQAKVASVGKKLSSVGSAINKAVAIPLAAIGAASIMAAKQFSGASHTIRQGTGATGEALEQLEGSFKKVFTTVPASADQAATAIADLNTRTGLTGKSLEDMATQMLNLARMAKLDVSTVIADTTRVFGDWSISTDKQAGALDYLWKVAQTTGIGVDQLSTTVVQFGAPLRQLGFDFETSAAMLGKWEKEGVNIETVLAGMKFGLGNFAKAGKDAKTALVEVTDKIKNAGTLAEANAEAIKVFGKRAGPDMAAAIREGRFDLDTLLQTLADSPETINKAAQETLGFGDKLTIMKNELATALVPLGEQLMQVFKDMLPTLKELIGYISQAVDWFKQLSPGWQDFITKALFAAIALGPVLSLIGKISAAAGPLITALQALGGAAFGTAGGIAALQGSLILLAAVVVGIGIYKLTQDILDGKRAADSYHESVTKVADGYQKLDEKQEIHARRSLLEAQTQVKLREGIDGVIRSSGEQAAMAQEIAQAWALAGADTKEELDEIAANILDHWDTMGSETAEALYGDDGLVVTNQNAWNQAVVDTEGALSEILSITQEKFDLINGIGKESTDEVVITSVTAFNQVATDIGLKLDEANSYTTEKFDLMKTKVETETNGIQISNQNAWNSVSNDILASLQTSVAQVNSSFSQMESRAASASASITASFALLQDKLVGHSIVPDMVNRVVELFGDMSDELRDKTRDMVRGVTDRFDDMKDLVEDAYEDMERTSLDALKRERDALDDEYDRMLDDAKDYFDARRDLIHAGTYDDPELQRLITERDAIDVNEQAREDAADAADRRAILTKAQATKDADEKARLMEQYYEAEADWQEELRRRGLDQARDDADAAIDARKQELEDQADQDEADAIAAIEHQQEVDVAAWQARYDAAKTYWDNMTSDANLAYQTLKILSEEYEGQQLEALSAIFEVWEQGLAKIEADTAAVGKFFEGSSSAGVAAGGGVPGAPPPAPTQPVVNNTFYISGVDGVSVSRQVAATMVGV